MAAALISVSPPPPPTPQGLDGPQLLLLEPTSGRKRGQVKSWLGMRKCNVATTPANGAADSSRSKGVPVKKKKKVKAEKKARPQECG